MHDPRKHADPGRRAPQLCFGLVRHARQRPARHAFAYRVFFLRLPLRAIGANGLGTRLLSRNRFNLMSFHDRDHGDGERPLVEWIDELLAREGIRDADGEVWLQTFPRVLGYVFNPVSFWFCHRADGVLRAVLCEVNNTFGERHCYLLDTGAPIGNGQELRARKVFHVSPFCRVEGGYRFRFAHRAPDETERAAVGAAERSLACVDYDDADGPLLATSIAGVAHPLTDGAAAKAFLTHPMMTLRVVVKIHWQAFRLWRRRVPFHRKPSPPAFEVTR